METPYPIRRRFDYPKISATTFETGGRVYHVPGGHAVPSVTTILGTLPKDDLIAWRERVGDEEANRVTAEACRIGTTMHDRLEGYVSAFLQGHPDIPPQDEEDEIAYQMADAIKRYALIDIDEIWGIEEALFCHTLYAGRTDLLGVFRGKSAVVDYKSTKKWKKPEWVKSYKMQLAAYNFCHFCMFQERMETGVILMAVRPPCREPLQMFVLQKDEMTYWEEQWLNLVYEYYSTRDLVMPDLVMPDGTPT